MKLHENLPAQGKFDIHPGKGVCLGICGADEAINVASRSVFMSRPFDKVREDLIKNGNVRWAYGFNTVHIELSIETLGLLWCELGDIAVTEDGVYLDEQFLHFQPGAILEDVWRWFEDANNRFRVYDHMYMRAECVA